MNQDVFIEEKREKWERLNDLLDQIRKDGIKSFTAQELQLMGSLYRKACSDLSYSRSKGFDPDLIRYLNQLARRAYGHIYLAESERRGVLWRFFVRDFPASVRNNFRYILLAIVLFSVGAGVGYVASHLDSSFARMVVPQEFLNIWENKERSDVAVSAFPVMASWYLTHNFQVGLYSFVSGILLGIGPLYLMLHNGLILGCLSSLVSRANYTEPFFSFVLAHSFVELMAIFICGGAGFMIAWALISPGDLSRSDALNRSGREAIKLVLGSIPLFLIAGIVESSFSRLNIHISYKIIFAIITIILMFLYFLYDPSKKNKRTGFKIAEWS